MKITSGFQTPTATLCWTCYMWQRDKNLNQCVSSFMFFLCCHWHSSIFSVFFYKIIEDLLSFVFIINNKNQMNLMKQMSLNKLNKMCFVNIKTYCYFHELFINRCYFITLYFHNVKPGNMITFFDIFVFKIWFIFLQILLA